MYLIMIFWLMVFKNRVNNISFITKARIKMSKCNFSVFEQMKFISFQNHIGYNFIRLLNFTNKQYSSFWIILTYK